MWRQSTARSSTRPGPGLAGCGEAVAEGSLLQAGEGVRKGNGEYALLCTYLSPYTSADGTVGIGRRTSSDVGGRYRCRKQSRLRRRRIRVGHFLVLR